MDANFQSVLQQACASCDLASKALQSLHAVLEKAANANVCATPKPKPKPTAKGDKSDSDDSDSEVEALPKPKAKPKPVVAMDQDSDSSDSDVPAPKPKPSPSSKPKPAAKEASDSDEESDGPPAKPKPKAKPAPAAVDDSDSDSDSDAPAAKPKPKPQPKAKPAAKMSDDSDSDSDDDEPPAKPAAKAKAKPAAKPQAEEDSDSDSDSDAPLPKPAPKSAPKPAAAGKRKQADAAPAPASKVQKLESRELVMFEIPGGMTDDDIWKHFKSLGDESITRLNRPLGKQTMCFITFKTPDLASKALALGPPSKGGSKATLKVNEPRGKGKGDKGGAAGATVDVLIKQCPDSITDDVVKEHFKEIAGSISRINWVINKEDGSFRGIGFIKFTSKEAADKAIKLGGPYHDNVQTTVILADGGGGKGNGKGKGKGKGEGKGGRGPSMQPEGEKVTFDD